MKRHSLTTRQIVLAGLMGALMVALKEALAAVPVELVTLQVILYTLELPLLAPWAIAVFVVLEHLLYGFGFWSWMYLYIWYLLFFAVRLFRRQDNVWFWAIFSAGYGLAFGALCTPVYFLVQGIGGALAWWIAGIPTDIGHGVCNFLVALALYTPLRKALRTLNGRWNR